MIKNNQRMLNKAQVCMDAGIIGAAYFFSWYLRFKSGFFVQDAGVLPAKTYFSALFLIIPGYLLLYSIFQLYMPRRVKSYRKELMDIIRANGIGFMIFILVLYFIKQEHFSRQMLCIFFFINISLEFASRYLIRTILWKMRKQGLNQKHILMIGESQMAEQYMDRLRENPKWGYQVFAHLKDEEKLERILEGNELDEVVIALRAEDYGKLERIVDVCEKAGVHTKMIPDFGNVISTRPYIEDVQGIPVIHVRRVPLNIMRNRAAKRAVDLIGATVAIILFSPVMLLTVLVVALTEEGSVIYRQERVGLHNQVFYMYKFRSMIMQDEEKEKAEWSTRNDPRITPVGKLIRRTSIDELPQLFNVLKGEMSLVGPRPERPQFVQKFRDEIPRYMVKHQVRPGMTGWAQINGYRGNTSIEKRIEYDLYYIENWTMVFDMKILILTIFKGFFDGR
ncbi:undecaprenyl-phosphate glucose phosphotransferase [Coprococcus comes]|uniref:undecaprenyl-phosphate glucose phosphotransferase n=2 Tax=Coprococcus comes TaxID=410072 RepID=UPI000820BFDE|nr:undecaprenyl-phosphate glucose phosphotransferase [Coprococcus comes]MBT9751154.1 undecaprenyl-phosphate glucose phosphotransferase [Coprococcus comes]MDB1813269.1 undecaprenyl-phosphate glucose phosphotransferase [Coprococcus comes]MDB1816310.1 undecaprenyl-phosphate glucose phosphotransferase [Coprococcus comes]MDC0784652.1 undecaprenyl-phosphate glucose phosphotransferase [Coprococcus comes]MDC0788103.1 undecaprenyl-phosphate glucose phosphotransferase [Coprococcus comes]